MSDQAHYILSLNESSWARMLWLAMTGAKFTVLEVAPAVSTFQKPLDRLASWARKRSNHKALPQLDAWQAKIEQDPNILERMDLFHEMEPWIAEHFGFDELDSASPYTFAFKQLAANFCVDRLPLVFALADVFNAIDPKTIRFTGFSADMIALFKHHNKKLIIPDKKVFGHGTYLKIALCLSVMVFGLGWILRRVRLRIRRHEVFLMADYVHCGNYMELVNAVRSCGKSVLLVPPRILAAECELQAADCPRTSNEAGQFGPAQALAAAALILGDGLRLLLIYISHDARILAQMLLCPVRKMRFRGLFNRYSCSYFYSRDIYNTDHIMRTWELRRLGAVSMGAMQNTPSWTIHQVFCRYLDYDILYVIGNGLTHHYQDTWPEQMKIRPGFTLRITREIFDLAKARPPTNDVGIFIVAAVDWKAMYDFTRGLADRFTDRKIIVKIKEGYRDLETDKSIREMIEEDGNRVIVTDENTYSLMMKIGYAFSNPSTVIPELVQMGVTAFAIDTPGLLKRYYFRDFPGFCVSGPDEAIERIEAIEAGKWQYPRQEYEGLVELSGTHYVDIIKQDLGLVSAPVPQSAPAAQSTNPSIEHDRTHVDG